MPRKDQHSEPFDEVTVTKLEIFEEYAEAWIPVFLMQSKVAEIRIFDFFAGTGYDMLGIPGSPIRILEKLNKQLKNILEKNILVNVYFNEFDENKYELLQSACRTYLENNPVLAGAVKMHFYNEDFEICFSKLYSCIKESPSLVYLDQNGIKFLETKYLMDLESSGQTDFLYFVSSSYFWRFGETEEFERYMEIGIEEIKRNPYQFIHRTLIEQLRKKLPKESRLRLYPFSLKKGTNIYGIIFGASHPKAVEKFLRIAWEKDKLSGEANFDINDDKQKDQMSLFSQERILKKKESFEMELTNLILSGKIRTNFDAYNYSLEAGFLGSHAAQVLKRLKNEKKIDYDGKSPLVTYDNAFNSEKRKKLQYRILRK